MIPPNGKWWSSLNEDLSALVANEQEKITARLGMTYVVLPLSKHPCPLRRLVPRQERPDLVTAADIEVSCWRELAASCMRVATNEWLT